MVWREGRKWYHFLVKWSQENGHRSDLNHFEHFLVKWSQMDHFLVKWSQMVPFSSKMVYAAYHFACRKPLQGSIQNNHKLSQMVKIVKLIKLVNNCQSCSISEHLPVRAHTTLRNAPEWTNLSNSSKMIKVVAFQGIC